MASEKQQFLKAVKVLIDTREQKNAHIIEGLSGLGVSFEPRKLDFGDYSFEIGGRDFSGQCVIERKSDVLELYGNIMEHRKDSRGSWVDIGERIQKELDAAHRNGAQLVMLIEQCADPAELKAYKLKPHEKTMCGGRLKTEDIGKTVYSRLKSWQTANRYNFRIEYCKNATQSAAMILEEFYYYYRNYKESIAPRR